MPVKVAYATVFPGPKSVGVSISTYDLRGVREIRAIVDEVAPNEEAQFLELMLAVNFAFRQLSNLGGGREADDIAHRLDNLQYAERTGETALTDISGLKVDTASPQTDGERRIDIELRFSVESSQLWIKPSGFGFMNRKLWEYIPNCVVALFVALAVCRRNERPFVRRLLLAAREVVRQWRLGAISLRNHAQVSLTTAVAAWSVSVDGDYCEDRPGHLTPGTGEPAPKYSTARQQSASSADEMEVAREETSEFDAAAIARLLELQYEKTNTLVPSMFSIPLESGDSQVEQQAKDGHGCKETVETPPESSLARDEALAEEISRVLRRSDGYGIVRSMRHDFEKDISDWFYECVWNYFANLPKEDWSEDESLVAEWHCRLVIPFFQSVIAAAAAVGAGYVPQEQHEWLIEWLLRLNLGDQDAAEARNNWVPAFIRCSETDEVAFFVHHFGKSLPNIPWKSGLLALLHQPLVKRTNATVARAFGDLRRAAELHSESAVMEQELAAAIELFSVGGATAYLLENEDGFLFSTSRDYGEVLNLWWDSAVAEATSEKEFGGSHRVVPLTYRSLADMLDNLSAEGCRFVCITNSEDEYILPIMDLRKHVHESIEAAESSPVGKVLSGSLE